MTVDDKVPTWRPRPTVRDLVGWAARASHIPRRVIMSERRDTATFRARAAVAWAAYRHLGKTSHQIGTVLKRDHTTVLDAVKRAEELRSDDNPEFVALTEHLARKLAEPRP